RPGLWSEYHASLGLDARAVFPGMRFDQFSMLIEGAVAGLGAAILPSYLIEAELASGALVQTGQLVNASGSAYFIATPTGQRN
ncbi:LysR substrate-binding domain-containing protein, partial [Ruegeria sp. NA]